MLQGGCPSSRRSKLCVDCSMIGGTRNIYFPDITIEGGRHLLASSVLAGALTVYCTTNVSFVAWAKLVAPELNASANVRLYVPAGVLLHYHCWSRRCMPAALCREKLSARPASVAALLQTPVNDESSAQSSQYLSRPRVVSTVLTDGWV
jgi:hypothetical protein